MQTPVKMFSSGIADAPGSCGIDPDEGNGTASAAISRSQPTPTAPLPRSRLVAGSVCHDHDASVREHVVQR